MTAAAQPPFTVADFENGAIDPGSDWFRFRRHNDDLSSDGRILQRYYDNETLASDQARQSFVLPNRLAA
jgi:hypothetical protein